MLRGWVDALVNKVEELEHEKKAMTDKIVRLEAQVRKLQGLPAKPHFDPKDKTSELDKDDEDEDDDDSEGSPKNKTGKKRSDAAKKSRRKKKDLAIDVTKKLSVCPDDLDATFEYKGTRKVVVQDILFQRNNIAFELEKFYSREHGKTVEADLPTGYEGGYFGPNVITFIKCSYYEGDVTIPKIYRMLKAIGIQVSKKQINRIINEQPDDLCNEMDEAREAAIEKAGYQQIDDTVVKIFNESSVYTTVTCNPFFTNLYTSDSKNRSNAIMALCGGNKEPLYKLNQQAIIVTFTTLKSLKIQIILEKYQSERVYSESEINELFNNEDFLKLKPPTLRDIKTAMLVGAFYDGHLGITGEALVSDDAPQFNNIFDNHGLCWYHEMRHYKELEPLFADHAKEVKLFFTEAKQMYKFLKAWCVSRSDEVRDYLFRWFHEFFSEETGYRLLDQRKKKTLAKMEKLLAPLWAHARIPPQNNESERDIRGRKIKQKISMFDRTWSGARARDLYISLKQTCRKLGISFYQYLLDRKCRLGRIQQLVVIIQAA